MSTNRSYRTTLLLAGALAAVVAAVFVFGDPMADPPRPPRPPDRVQATPDNVPRGEPAAEGPYAGVDVQLARVSEIAGAERLESAAAVRLGDRLRIGISTDRELHVYAFNREEGGKPTVMFPLAVLDARNPLPPGEHELPGTVKGAHQSYTVESKAPSEDVLVIVSEQPLPTLQARVDSLAGLDARGAARTGADVDFDTLVAEAGDAVAVHRWTLRHEAPAAGP
jgi:hypothetical protein